MRSNYPQQSIAQVGFCFYFRSRSPQEIEDLEADSAYIATP